VFRWLDVGGGVDAQVRGLIGVIEEDLKDANAADGTCRPLRMMVFTKDTAASKGVAARLEAAFDVGEDGGHAGNQDILIVSYHKGMRQEDRADALQALRDETRPIVLVCTDATARGLDVPGVSHVVHADFPASAIDFIHRSGRTGRAGANGVVTSLVGSESVDLAEAIKELMDDDDALEGAFSRNRSFRKKHKKYGRFVKRGEVG
jgi:superfamily II DNA/RNA helicase